VTLVLADRPASAHRVASARGDAGAEGARRRLTLSCFCTGRGHNKLLGRLAAATSNSARLSESHTTASSTVLLLRGPERGREQHRVLPVSECVRIGGELAELRLEHHHPLPHLKIVRLRRRRL
jgi:hypothetical protein